jgi:hypothetical protein
MNFRIPAKKHSSRLGYVTKLEQPDRFFYQDDSGTWSAFRSHRLHALRLRNWHQSQRRGGTRQGAIIHPEPLTPDLPTGTVLPPVRIRH